MASKVPLYIISFCFIGFVVFLILFFIIPHNMERAILDDEHTDYYTALGNDNFTEWENIPGDRGVNKTHTF